MTPRNHFILRVAIFAAIAAGMVIVLLHRRHEAETLRAPANDSPSTPAVQPAGSGAVPAVLVDARKSNDGAVRAKSDASSPVTFASSHSGSGSSSLSLAAIAPMTSMAPRGDLPPEIAPLESASPAFAFCPIGTVEKKTKSEHWCASADKGGIGFKQGPYRATFADGKKKIDGAFDDGLPGGRWTEYFRNGHKSAEGEYRDGRKSGAWTAWWESGVKSSQGIYKDGAKNGHWIFFSDDGRKESEGDLRTSDHLEQKDGRWTYWWPNGSKKSEGPYRDGRKNGRWTEWDRTGRVVTADDYRDGDKEMP